MSTSLFVAHKCEIYPVTETKVIRPSLLILDIIGLIRFNSNRVLIKLIGLRPDQLILTRIIAI